MGAQEASVGPPQLGAQRRQHTARRPHRRETSNPASHRPPEPSLCPEAREGVRIEAEGEQKPVQGPWERAEPAGRCVTWRKGAKSSPRTRQHANPP
jgi:hypothetical protein